ncbi:MAG TPA: polysaccharide biosynthesis/export family protein [Terracidiphilus sp.]|nr:polysaccharide biosynthesis/export family protein [Terracidiphilus sp.]
MNRFLTISGPCICLAGIFTIATGHAQAPPASPSAPASQAAAEPSDELPTPQLKPNPLEALRKFEPAADEEYQLGKGDEIQIDFTGRPELQAKLIVGPDGRITLPLAGEVMLAGASRSEAAKKIETALTPFYANLSVLVTVTRYTANRVLVLGAVDHPGPMVFDGNPTLLEAITRGGLPLVGPLKRPQIPDQCAIYRGSDQVMWVQLRQLVESGNPLADLRLRRDDVVYVPDPSERFVSVLGEVNHPGAVELDTNTTLVGVLAMAGGLTEKAGGKPHIQIIDPKTGTSRSIAFKDLLNPTKTLEVTLKPGEVIFVPESGFYRATYLLEKLNPLATLATLAAVNGAL